VRCVERDNDRLVDSNFGFKHSHVQPCLATIRDELSFRRPMWCRFNGTCSAELVRVCWHGTGMAMSSQML